MRHRKKSLSLQQKVFILRTYYECKDVQEVKNATEDSFQLQASPSFTATISKLVDTFESTGSVNQSYSYEVIPLEIKAQERTKDYAPEDIQTGDVMILEGSGDTVLYDVIIEEAEDERDAELEDAKPEAVPDNDDDIEFTIEEEEDEVVLSTPTDSAVTASMTAKEKAARLKERRSKKHACKYCNKVFCGRYLVAHYKKKHSDKAVYPCSKCPEAFRKWSDYTDHRATHQHQKPTLQCEFCHKPMANVSTFNRHMKSHLGVREHVCELCGKTFQEAVALKLHRRSHTGEKPYDCKICGKAFATKSSWTVHNRTHTGEKPYKCTYCDKAFADSSTRNVRTRTTVLYRRLVLISGLFILPGPSSSSHWREPVRVQYMWQVMQTGTEPEVPHETCPQNVNNKNIIV